MKIIFALLLAVAAALDQSTISERARTNLVFSTNWVAGHGSKTNHVFVLPEVGWPVFALPTNYESFYYETNVTSGNNEVGCHTCGWLQEEQRHGRYPSIWHPWHYEATPYKAPTERWWTTNITKIAKLRLTWRGKQEEIVRTETVTNITVRSKLKSEWTEPEIEPQKEANFHPIIFSRMTVATNYIGIVPGPGVIFRTNATNIVIESVGPGIKSEIDYRIPAFP